VLKHRLTVTVHDSVKVIINIINERGNIMKRHSVLLVILMMFALTFAPKASYALGLEIGAGYWGQDPSGNMAYEPVSSVDELDLEEDLNYDEEYKPFARIKADMPLFLPNIYFMATPVKFEETGSKTESFKFGDTTFDGTVPFDSKFKADIYDFCLYYSVPLLETASLNTLNVEAGLNVRIIDLEAEVSGSDSLSGVSVTESESVTVPVPMIYAAVQFKPLDSLSIEAEGRGIVYSSNHYYDVIGRVKVKLLDPFFIAGGYRYNDLEIDYHDVEASIKLGGPFIEGGVEF
jgi:outer membrane protein